MLVNTLKRSRRTVHDDDGALLARMAAGEHEDALIALYARYGRRLYGFGYRLLGDSSQAEELVQETFVRAWVSASRYDPSQCSPQSWMLMLARRVAIDLQRRAAVRPRAAEHRRGADDELVDPLATIPAEDELERIVLGLEVRDALRALAPQHREVLELGYDDQLTQREIAERLAIPLGTVKTRTFHALRALKVALGEQRLG